MAKDWIPIVGGNVNNRSNELSISKGRGLTGRYFFDLGFEPPVHLSVEVWDRKLLIEQSKTVPPTSEGINESAMIEKYRIDGPFTFGELFAVKLGVYPESLFISCFQPGGSLVSYTLWLEIE